MIIIGAIVGIIVLNSMTAPFCTGAICVPEEGEENLKMYGVAFMDDCTGICAGTQYVECEGVILDPREYNYTELLILNSTFCEYELIHDYDYEIWSWTDLNATRDNLSASYILMRDLTTFDADYLTFNDPTTDGWNPIGTTALPFTGEFNGNWRSIDGLHTTTTMRGGLFHTIYSASISNLFLTEVNATSMQVGGLAGSIKYTTINNVLVTGSILGIEESEAGGLVGISSDSIVISSSTTVDITTNSTMFSAYAGGLIGTSSNTTIYNCNSYGTLSTTQNHMHGGLIGGTSLTGATIVNKSHSSVIVNAPNGMWVGGLIGYLGTDTIITNSYATGNVTGNDRVGGLIGDTGGGTIINSYATGYVTGTTNVGGLIGAGVPIVTNSYWDNITSGQTTSAGGTPFNTTHMTTPYGTFNPPNSPDGPYHTWDFDNTWEHDTWTINDGYPTLQYEFTGETCTQHWEEDTGTGTTGGILGYIICLLPVLAALGILAIAILGVVIM